MVAQPLLAVPGAGVSLRCAAFVGTSSAGPRPNAVQRSCVVVEAWAHLSEKTADRRSGCGTHEGAGRMDVTVFDRHVVAERLPSASSSGAGDRGVSAYATGVCRRGGGSPTAAPRAALECDREAVAFNYGGVADLPDFHSIPSGSYAAAVPGGSRAAAIQSGSFASALQSASCWRADRGRENRLNSVPPPSEPDGRISRIRLSGRWFDLKEE